jgi:hypothetical protein
MRWSFAPVLAVLLLVPSVTFADEAPSSQKLQLELGGSLGVGGTAARPDGLRAGFLYQPWKYAGFSVDVQHFLLDVPEWDHGLHTYDTGTLSLRAVLPIGPVRIFLAPGIGLARGRYLTGDLNLHDRVQTGPAVIVRAGAEASIAKGILVGTAFHAVGSYIDGEWGPEGNAGVDLYAGYRF